MTRRLGERRPVGLFTHAYHAMVHDVPLRAAAPMPSCTVRASRASHDGWR
jgi:hypothetical protein